MGNNREYNRIAKNTIVLYLRMLLTIVISFYTTRITLEALGVDDYGIYNVLGGMVALCTVFTGSISVAISRFINIEIGNANIDKLKRIFSNSVLVMLILAVLICGIAEVVGIWFIDCKMNIPTDKIVPARWAIQCFIFSFMLELICTPYNALIIAHERMSAFAMITIINTVLKLGIAFSLFLFESHRLVVYALLCLIVSSLMRLIYGVYCKRNFEECKFSFQIDKHIIRDMSKFTGWAFLGNATVQIKDQGTNLVMNVFCGLVVNAARGIALQVCSALEGLVNNFMMAVNPQIMQSFAKGDYEYMNSLVLKSSKFGSLILFLFAFPIAVNINYILSIWLSDVPDYTASFIVLSLIYSLIACLCSPLLTSILAEGNIRNYEISITVLFVVNFVVSYLLLKASFSPNWVFVANIICKIFVLLLMIIIMAKKFSFNIRRYLVEVILPIAAISAACIVTWSFIPTEVSSDFKTFIINFLLSFILGFIFCLLFGVRKKEYAYIRQVIISKFKKD